MNGRSIGIDWHRMAFDSEDLTITYIGRYPV